MRKYSCIICHGKIEIESTSKLQIFLDNDKNFARCINDHYVHLEPCLRIWVVQSNKCPLCNITYAFEDFINKARESENSIDQENNVKSLASEIVNQLQNDEHDKIIESKLDLAKYFIKNNQDVNALDVLFNLLDNIDSKNVEALFLIGKIRYENGRFGLAVSNLMKVVKIKYDYPLAFYYLGKSYEQLGLTDNSNWAFKRASENLKKIIEESENGEDLLELKEILNDIAKIQSRS